MMTRTMKTGLALSAVLAVATPFSAAAQNRPSMSVGWQWLSIGQSECVTRIRASYAAQGWTDIASGDNFSKAHKGAYGSYAVCNPARDGDMEVDIFITFGGDDPNGDLAQAQRILLQDEMKRSR